jgi:hypothetical protein
MVRNLLLTHGIHAILHECLDGIKKKNTDVRAKLRTLRTAFVFHKDLKVFQKDATSSTSLAISTAFPHPPDWWLFHILVYVL